MQTEFTGALVWELPSTRRRPVEGKFLDLVGIQDRTEALARSIEDPEWFWGSVCEFLRIPWIAPPERIMRCADHMSAARWFEDAKINLAHACLAKWTGSHQEALVAESEDGTIIRWTGSELIEEVKRGAAALRELGLGPGDRVVLLLPLSGQGVISLLSVAWMGAVAVPVFSGFGVEATALRIRDSQAAAVVTQTGVTRRGRPVDLPDTAQRAITESGIPAKLMVWDSPATGDAADWSSWPTVASRVAPMEQPYATSASDPVLIAYTSGTTGKPKGVVHAHGGLTVKLAQEAAFQLDVQAGDRISWVTDLGWIMSCWVIVGGLANEATVVCYSGAPDFPDPGRIVDFARQHRVTAIGLAPTLVRAVMASAPAGFGEDPLPDVLTFGSSGEAWTPEAWWWLFEALGHRRVPIINFTGGTEVGACFLSASLLDGIKPLSVGNRCWGMAVDIWSPEGSSTGGLPGELVCTQPWPSMATTVWGDHSRFLETYFSTWPDVWRHGDRASFDADGFWTLHGRSDDVMNVAGKRLGPVEVESAALSVAEVQQAAAVGLPHDTKGETVALFVVLSGGVPLTEAVRREISSAVIASLGKAFAPSVIIAVPDLPRTRTAKTVRRAIRAICLGQDPGDLSTVDNPEVLRHFPASHSPTSC